MLKTLIVTDQDHDGLEVEGVEVLPFDRYLRDYPKKNEPKTRVINLCDTELYLSKGYYCSLLAEARGHKVLPSVRTINQLASADDDIYLQAKMPLSQVLADGASDTFFIYFGEVEDQAFKKIASRIYASFPAPLLLVTLRRQGENLFYSVTQQSLQDLNSQQQTFFFEQLNQFTVQVWRSPSSKKRYRWDMAILVNPDEPTPPSDKAAIKRFIKAAEKFGIYAETVTAESLGQISRYDALFIRETTAINHHTYTLARKAEDAGLVVMDDPDSILRCCNKVFLHDAFSYQDVPSLKTRVITTCGDDVLDELEQEFEYPMVLKIPEGSFSKGVFKVSERQELRARLEELFQSSALALVQEYLYTDFDWRIGVLNGRAIYACRYLMARNHWQIYNHESKRFNSGGFETLPTFELPKKVMDAAIKAAGVVGRGLYGVDMKQKNNNVYVIEVNDNPSLEHKVEDAYLGDELYMLIMSEFYQRLERRGR
ncbi:MAG: RimK family protein [Gammaproteobacteria bacterium]|uniref:RimK family protein n=1 Tax=Pseudomaricurvus alcaniphilus TaxID=1166482 RepID=UPI001409CA18|nr:RimK family protein [Pseudomaricurvus alcaniphilus]MBR9909619.1 RimK family protein [Gammaproteobacteria bacterium]NHN36965.1 RimK family protein [Pseudomaricurvus alcaniphilus]